MQNTHDEFPGADDEKQHTDTQTHNSNSSTNSKDNNDTAAQDLRLHPLQLEDQPQPWLIPHPNFPISWRDDGQTQSIQNDTHSQEYQVGSQASYPSTSSKPSTVLCIQDSDGDSSTQRSTSRDGASSRSHLQEYDWRLQQQQQQLQQLRQYRNSASDQGHESDPSELLRPPVLFGNPYPVNLLQAQEYSQQDHEGLYPVRRSHRSMSLSIAPNNVWRDNSSARALSSSHTSSDHHEVVPYTQEWRVILRSPPRGRTVLYNPQMQSLVVQSTVGLDSHPMSLREDSAVCALCRRPLDLNETVDEQFDEKGESYMDTNYFRMLADANTALSRRGSLQGDSETPLRSRSPIGVPTSSSRTTLDLDSQPQGHSASSQLSHDALNQGYYERFFVEQKKLGKGYRGSVFLCQHVLDGIHLGEYAIKKVAVGDNHDWLVQMLREVHLLERLHHPNIVSYKHAWLENHQLHKFGPEVTCLFILMECANGGNLEEYIEHPPIDLSSMNADPESVGGEAPSRETESQTPATAKGRALQAKRQRLQSSLNLASGKNGRGIGANGSNSRDTDATSQRHYLSVTEIWSFFFDICEGLAHLHRLGIIHRDLKPPNLLLSYSNSRIKGTKGERPRVLITDFGECEILEQAAKRDRTGATGTLEFLAPELLDVDADGKYTDEFSFKGDMWSLGMVLYYLCYSRLPYSQIDDVDLLRQEIRQVTSIPIPEDDGPGGRVLPDELKFLIRMLLSPEKLKRPSCDEILSKLSQQRDRMMHGDMESTPIPVHVSTNIEEEKDGLQEADNITDEGSSTKNAAATASVGATRSSSSLLTPPTRLSTKTTTAKARGSNSGSRSPHLHPQNYPVIGRRASRPMLVTERVKATTSGSNANHHHSSSSLSSPYPTRSSASPSVNLHKKIKPLGLGIRYMLRRKMMHHLAANPGGGQESQRYSKNNDGGGYSGSSTSPLPLTLVRPKSTSVTSSVDMEQNSKSLVRSSPLRMNMLPPPRPPPAEQYQHQPPPPLKRQQDEDMKDVSRPHNPPSSGARPSDGLDPSHDSHGLEDVPKSRRGSVTSIHGEPELHPFVGADGYTRTMVEDRGNQHWAIMAAACAHEKSQSIGTSTSVSTATTTTEGVKPATESVAADGQFGYSTDDESPESTTSGIAAELKQRRRQQQQQGLRPRRRRDSRSLQGHHRRNSRTFLGVPPEGGQEESASEHQLQRLPPRPLPPQPLPPPPLYHQQQLQSLQLQRIQNSYAALPEHFSGYFMFLSLVFRTWFCLSLCNPIMVRPIVLYPVLVLTAVWDRYVLSLITDTFFRVRTLSHRPRRGSLAERRGSASISERGPFIRDGRRSMDDTATATTMSMARSLRSEGISIGAISEKAEDDGGGDDQRQDDNVEDRGKEGDAERFGDDSLAAGMIGRYEPEVRKHPEDDRYGQLEPIWWALAIGFALQLLWIAAVWLFSRGGICAA